MRPGARPGRGAGPRGRAARPAAGATRPAAQLGSDFPTLRNLHPNSGAGVRPPARAAPGLPRSPQTGRVPAAAPPAPRRARPAAPRRLRGPRPTCALSTGAQPWARGPRSRAAAAAASSPGRGGSAGGRCSPRGGAAPSGRAPVRGGGSCNSGRAGGSAPGCGEGGAGRGPSGVGTSERGRLRRERRDCWRGWGVAGGTGGRGRACPRCCPPRAGPRAWTSRQRVPSAASPAGARGGSGAAHPGNWASERFPRGPRGSESGGGLGTARRTRAFRVFSPHGQLPFKAQAPHVAPQPRARAPVSHLPSFWGPPAPPPRTGLETPRASWNRGHQRAPLLQRPGGRACRPCGRRPPPTCPDPRGQPSSRTSPTCPVPLGPSPAPPPLPPAGRFVSTFTATSHRRFQAHGDFIKRLMMGCGVLLATHPPPAHPHALLPLNPPCSLRDGHPPPTPGQPSFLPSQRPRAGGRPQAGTEQARPGQERSPRCKI